MVAKGKKNTKRPGSQLVTPEQLRASWKE